MTLDLNKLLRAYQDIQGSQMRNWQTIVQGSCQYGAQIICIGDDSSSTLMVSYDELIGGVQAD